MLVLAASNAQAQEVQVQGNQALISHEVSSKPQDDGFFSPLKRKFADVTASLFGFNSVKSKVVVREVHDANFYATGNGNISSVSAASANPNNSIDNLGNGISFNGTRSPHEYTSVVYGDESTQFSVDSLSLQFDNDFGSLTVGDDWANFSDLLGRRSVLGLNDTNNANTQQISWRGHDGFGVHFQQNTAVTANDITQARFYDGLPSGLVGNHQEEITNLDDKNLVLSWQSAVDHALFDDSEYQVSAIGRVFDDEQNNQGNTYGWGLNLSGDWRYGRLSAGLNLTYGQGIAGYLLNGSVADTRLVNGQSELVDTYVVNPQLKYQWQRNSAFHVTWHHIAADADSDGDNLDTLDSVHLGYTWSPWPSTKIGIELMAKDASTNGNDNSSSAVRIGASKDF